VSALEVDGSAAVRGARDFLLRHRTDHEAAVASFHWPRPGHFNWALDWFDGVLTAEHPDRKAIIVIEADGRSASYTFAGLSARSDQVAHWLRAQGVGRGMRLLLLLGNQIELWETMLAAAKLGAVVIPAATLLTPEDLRDRVDRGAVGAVVARSDVTPGFAEVHGAFLRIAVGEQVEGWLRYSDTLESLAPFFPDGPTGADDPLLLYFTSGTTALPKLVQHTHSSYPIGHLSTMFWIGLRPGDVHLNVSSPGWAKHAWSCVFAPWLAGATVAAFNYSRFDASTMLDVLREQRVNTFCAPPTVWRMLVQADLAAWELPELRELVGAGEPLNPEVIEQVQRAWDKTVRDGFGQTESSLQIGNAPGAALRLGSMGRPMPGFDVVMVDPISGERVAEGEGEICLDLEGPAGRPVGLMTGYRSSGEHADVEATRMATKDGVYHTGDVASRDSDGYITYVGRADDVFKAADYRISPFELESVLIQHPAVAEAAIVPAPDELRLAVPKAYIALVDGYEPSKDLAGEILAHARENLAPYKRIRRLEFAALPKTISGKIRRVQLRTAERERGDVRRENEFREEDFR